MKKNIVVYAFIIIVLPAMLSAQEALKSIEEEYYHFLSLQGLTERPALNYRTLSDSVWAVDETAEHPWKGQNLGTFHPLFGDFRMRVYGPELFMSANTEAPYGQNDGVLWQGRGFNALFKTGIRFEGYGFELTLLPHFAFSQNAPFEIMESYYTNEYGYFWGLGEKKSNAGGADAPQRFGDKPFFDWDFGDSEIRYTWKTFTVGFGTQAIWQGPSYLYSILHSNNAPAYPKFDIGLRRQSVTIPGLDWYMGDVEARMWIGRLSESDYYDSNDYTMIHGWALAYAPSFLPGLTLFVNRICLVPWDWENLRYINPIAPNTIEDQKASLGFSWLLPEAGFEVYGELGIDDYTNYVQHPFHTTVYAGGLKKAIRIKPENGIYGEIAAEFIWMEMTQDYQFSKPYTFYFHHIIKAGYTNRGQWLGNGDSPGGNSQYLSFMLYYPRGSSLFFVSRNNPDDNYLYSKAVNASAKDDALDKEYGRQQKANLIFGLSTTYFFNEQFILSGGIVYNQIMNPLYKRYPFNPDGSRGDIIYQHNFSFQLSIKYSL